MISRPSDTSARAFHPLRPRVLSPNYLPGEWPVSGLRSNKVSIVGTRVGQALNADEKSAVICSCLGPEKYTSPLEADYEHWYI